MKKEGSLRQSDKDELIQVYLTRGQLNVLQSLIREREERDTSNTLDALIEKAQAYKKLAREYYPKDKCEIWIDEEDKQINFNFPDHDSFWNNVKISELIIQYYRIHKEINDSKPRRRIYV